MFVVGGVAVVLLVVIAVSAISGSSAPADGSPCPEASSEEIRAWVESKESELADDVSVGDVVDEVEWVCSDAYFSNTPQPFSLQLLEYAEEQARPQKLSPRALEWLQQRTPGETNNDPDKDRELTPEEWAKRP
jgi:hypothetical protein